MLVHAFHAAELVKQLKRGFFANAFDSGNVVGRIAHQSFEVDDLRRTQVVGLPQRLFVH